MIRNEREYKATLRRMRANKEIIKQQMGELKTGKLSAKSIKRAMAPILSFHQQIVEEVQWYKNAKMKKFGSISSLNQIGRLLIALRIASGLSQTDLARCLDIYPAQVSKDETNEYHGISIERAATIISILGARVKLTVNICKDRPFSFGHKVAQIAQIAPRIAKHHQVINSTITVEK